MESSPLATLPPEIRIYIFELVLSQPHPLSVGRTALQTRSRLRLINPSKHLLALTATCRRIREETRLLFFRANALRINDQAIRPSPRALSALPETIGPDAMRALRRIYIVFAPLQCAFERWHGALHFQGRFQGCSCTEGQLRLAEVREWLLARPEARVTVVMGWFGSSVVEAVDVRDLDALWMGGADCSGDPDLVAIVDDVCWPGAQSWDVSTSLEQHRERLERFRVGIKQQAGIRQMGWLGRARDPPSRNGFRDKPKFIDSDGTATW